MRLYQERMNIYIPEETKEVKGDDTDSMKVKMGMVQATTHDTQKKSSNYLRPLQIAYKHKIEMLDKHVRRAKAALGKIQESGQIRE